jgi:LTR polyprotein gag-polypeptide-like protein
MTWGTSLKSVKKLVSDGSNWVTYHDRMIWSLRFCGLLDHLTSTTTTASYTNASNINNITPQARWDTNEAITMQVIAASIPNSVFTNIKSKTTARDVWNALKAMYEGRTIMMLVRLSQQLQSMHYGDDDNIRKHFDKLADLKEQLATMGKSIPNSEYASILMGSLPTSYASMLGSIAPSAEMSGMAVSPAVVVKLATDEYDQRTLQSGKGQDEAFTADSQKKKKDKKHDVECEICHKKGHTKARVLGKR